MPRHAQRVEPHEEAPSGERTAQGQRLGELGLLAGSVAHDVNHLLAVIQISASNALEELGGAGPAAEELRRIRTAVLQAGLVTRQVVALSRDSSGPPGVLQAERVVQELTPLLRCLAGTDVTLDLAACSTSAPVLASPGALEQVLVNLAVNARDAMGGHGALSVRVGSRRIAQGDPLDVPPGDWVCLAVRDTGCGMDAGVQEHLFEPFFTTKAPGAGTGLGLSTCQAIVRRLGGTIRVRSRPGAGATFQVLLPRAGRPQPKRGLRLVAGDERPRERPRRCNVCPGRCAIVEPAPDAGR